MGVYYIRRWRLAARAIEELMASDMQTKGEFYLADAFTVMIEQGARFGVREVSVWEDCGTPQDVLKTNRYFLEHGRDNGGEAASPATR